jgi:proteasome alpha subunit
MSYSFYDWNQALQQRNEYVEDRLKDGSPVIAVSYDDGILMLTLRGAQQRKVYEVYDRLMLGAIGKQSDIESLRRAAIDQAHQEGFERSPDDVTIQRIVGFALSPAVRRVYNDQQSIPLTLRAVFAEMNRDPLSDHYYVMGYDGEFAVRERCAVAAGTPYAEEQAEAALKEASAATLEDALKAALNAWGVGRARLAPKAERDDEDEYDPLRERDGGDDAPPPASDDPAVAVREALKNGLVVEAAVLNRNSARETKFRLLRDGEISEAVDQYR